MGGLVHFLCHPSVFISMCVMMRKRLVALSLDLVLFISFKGHIPPCHCLVYFLTFVLSVSTQNVSCREVGSFVGFPAHRAMAQKTLNSVC